MIESLLIKDIDLALPDGIRRGDVLVKNGKIAKMGAHIDEPAQFTLVEPNLLLMPGVIDPHVHFRQPGSEHKETIETGSMAAASGGVTSFFDMPNTSPPTTTLEALADKKRIASQTSLVNYNFFIGATPDNLDVLTSVKNVPGVKVYIGSTTGDLLVNQPAHIANIFKHCPLLIAVHAEDNAIIKKAQEMYRDSSNPADHSKIRPPEAALSATKMAINLAMTHKKRLHICHMSTKEEMTYLSSIEQPHGITCETTPQHLFLHEPDCYDRLGTFAQMNPPLRSSEHANVLWKALLSGHVNCLATDHAPHSVAEKSLPFGQAPSGIPGVETSLPLMLTQYNKREIGLPLLLKVLCSGPAQVFRIANKGRLQVGYDADFVLVDLKATRKLAHHHIVSKCGWTPFEGWTLQGLPIATFVNGQMVYREGEFFHAIKGKEIDILPN